MLRNRHQRVDGRADVLVDLLVPVRRLGADETRNCSRPIDIIREDEAMILRAPLEEVYRVFQLVAPLPELHLLEFFVAVAYPQISKVGATQVI
jgi:hypothetical protein